VELLLFFFHMIKASVVAFGCMNCGLYNVYNVSIINYTIGTYIPIYM
jgi:hypothetical protein